MYKKMTRQDSGVSEYVSASASAGEALHNVMGARDASMGLVEDLEPLLLDRGNQMSGHIDVIKKGLGVGDYKTVSGGIFNAIQREGKAKQMHRDQVMYYMGQTGQDKGFIQYIDRDNTDRQKTFQLKFDAQRYRMLIDKVNRVRERVENDVATGKISKRDLPMTAGPDTLIEADKNRKNIHEHAAELDERYRVFKEEMKYLNNVRRGMPSSGPGYNRIQKKKRELQKTQGLGLQIHKERNKHHYM
jgi:hypothetical protein